MRTNRPWSMDDFMALFSWLFLSNIFFILLGTTTFFSTLLFIANSFQFQEWVRLTLSKIISKQIGMEVSIGNAIVPNWKENKISMKQVKLQYNVIKDNDMNLPYPDSPAIWDLSFDNIEITLSLIRWLDGKGLVKDCFIKGMRGVIDRSQVTYPDEEFEPLKARQLNQKKDLELNSLIIEDCLITICHPYNFRPFQVSIFNANIPLLRQRWFLFDMMCANSIVGMFDNCLFSVHMAQNDINDIDKNHGFKRSHFRVDGVPIDQFNGGVEGPFGWITSGRVDFDVDFMIPQKSEEEDILAMVTNDFLIKVDEVVSKNIENLSIELPHHFPPLIDLLNTVNSNIKKNGLLKVQKRLDEGSHLEQLIFDFKIKFHNIKAGIPMNTKEFSLASQAVVRPVIAFMNSNRTLIPIQCRVVTDISKFDGSWTVYDSELAYDLSKEVSFELINLVQDERERNRRLKRVGLWGLQSLAKNLINLVEYARGVRGFWHYLGTIHEFKPDSCEY
ncbi:mitochondrial distribution and morphology protein family 31/32 [Neoconidiobolus thromboides FSU 785]|nr:mitochondrial distribution and morphology protein family 31/32 [Neoconidiobolus thromboides FSU 785]